MSYIANLWYIDPQCKSKTLWYNMQKWEAGIQHNMFIPNVGYYLFQIWSRDTCSYEYIVLTEKHVQKALGVNNVSSIWAFSEKGLIVLLQNYVHFVSSFNTGIFAVMVNGRDVTDKLKDYWKSLSLPFNATPGLIKLLLGHDEKVDFYLIDYDLQESRFANDAYIVT